MKQGIYKVVVESDPPLGVCQDGLRFCSVEARLRSYVFRRCALQRTRLLRTGNLGCPK
jgi:hypothetical protein